MLFICCCVHIIFTICQEPGSPRPRFHTSRPPCGWLGVLMEVWLFFAESHWMTDVFSDCFACFYMILHVFTRFSSILHDFTWIFNMLFCRWGSCPPPNPPLRQRPASWMDGPHDFLHMLAPGTPLAQTSYDLCVPCWMTLTHLMSSPPGQMIGFF